MGRPPNMKRISPTLIAVLVVLLIGGVTIGQRFRRDRYDDPRSGVPNWTSDAGFPQDVFTFARVRYSSWGGHRRGGKWHTDYPDSDLNFSFRVQELTSLEVDPDGRIVELTDEDLCDYPFLYMIEPGEMMLEEEEVIGLRVYLLSGGFLLVDDFWGEAEYENFFEQIMRVFPDQPPEDVPIEHEIFHCVYDLNEKPQIPSIRAFWSGQRTERWDAQHANYRAIYDKNGRIMVFICHNTDLGDGWEEEGRDPEYFREYAEKWSYPMGINILTYAMTH